jgi:hypothetical protein
MRLKSEERRTVTKARYTSALQHLYTVPVVLVVPGISVGSMPVKVHRGVELSKYRATGNRQK